MGVKEDLTMKLFICAMFAFALASLPLSASVFPTTANGLGDVITGAPVTGANPYDASDDALVGVTNNSGLSLYRKLHPHWQRERWRNIRF
jgi:hypothetical protein